MSEQSKRISRQELYEKIWIAPLKKVAEELETTYAELARLCDQLNVPKPAHGHWQRLKLGLPIEVFSLPEPTPGMAVEGMLKPKGLPKNKTIDAMTLKSGAFSLVTAHQTNSIVLDNSSIGDR
ncbi:MAG TPA: hypothetical protein VH413_13425 [Verrucomicrobiae bacterium]|jgi:hypothetical protein|nr:hypothetical protein [Verrucomicrobiae bacterium]